MKRLIILDLDNTFYKYDSVTTSGLESVYENQNIFNTYDDFILRMKILSLQSIKRFQKVHQNTQN